MPARHQGQLGSERDYTSRQRNSRIRHSHLALLLLLATIGAIFRVEPVLLDTVHFSYDQGLDLSHVRNLVENRKLSLIGRHTGLEGVFMGPLWTWMLAGPYLVSGGNPAANVLASTAVAIPAIFLTYALVARMVSQEAAAIAAFYVAVSPSFLAVSHVILSPYPLTILMVPYVWMLWEIIAHRKEGLFPFLGLTAGLFFQFEIGYAVVSLLATIAVLSAFGSLREGFNRSRTLGIGLFFLTFLPQVLFEFRHDFLMTSAIVRLLRGEQTSLGSEGVALVNRLVIRLGSLWEDFSSAVAFRGRSVPATLLVSIPAAIGLTLPAKMRQPPGLTKMCLLFIATVYLGFTVYPGPVWVWYRVGLPYLFTLLVAAGWARLLDRAAWIKPLAWAVFLAVAIWGLDPNGYRVRMAIGDQGGVSSIKNQKQALDIVFQDAGPEPFDLYIYTPPIYTYAWDHLLTWYAKSKYENYPEEYGYQRSDRGKRDFYLLIEPDEIQGRIDGWKGNFDARGELMETWETPVGMRIEKWQAGHE